MIQPLLLIVARTAVLAFLAIGAILSLQVTPFLALLCYFMYCSFWNLWGWAGLGHELAHNTFFKSSKANSIALLMVSLLTLSNSHIFKLTHFEHHADPHSDSDLESPYIFNLHHQPKLICLDKFLNFKKMSSTLRYLWLNSFGIIPSDSIYCRASKQNRLKLISFNSRLIVLYILLVSLLSLALWSFVPFAVLVAPNFLCCNLYSNLASLQHPTKSVADFFGLRIQTSDTFSDLDLRDRLDIKLPLFIEFFYAGMNYHATHHYRSSIRSYELAQYSEGLRRDETLVVGNLNSLGLLRLFFSG